MRWRLSTDQVPRTSVATSLGDHTEIRLKSFRQIIFYFRVLDMLKNWITPLVPQCLGYLWRPIRWGFMAVWNGLDLVLVHKKLADAFIYFKINIYSFLLQYSHRLALEPESEKITGRHLQRIFQYRATPCRPLVGYRRTECSIHDTDCDEVYPSVWVGDA